MGTSKDKLGLDNIERVYIEKVLTDELNRVDNRIQRNKKLYNLKSKKEDCDDDLSKYIDKIELEYRHKDALEKALSLFEPNISWTENKGAL